MTRIEKSSHMIGIRISKADKKYLAEVAALKGVSLSQFLRSSAVIEAHKVLGPPRLVAPLNDPDRTERER